eukprot:2932730-Pyramimonas_sp.AAC.1
MGKFWTSRAPRKVKKIVCQGMVVNTYLSDGGAWLLSDRAAEHIDGFIAQHARVLLMGEGTNKQSDERGNVTHCRAISNYE